MDDPGDQDVSQPGQDWVADASGHGSASSPAITVRYRECQKNHAVSLGGHAVDGCGEFIPRGDDPLRCAACECHRNFHRKETEFHQPAHLPSNPPTASSSGDDDSPNPSSYGARKRFRTKFSAEQKERMVEFAERIGWRMPRQEVAEIDRFCSEIGVTRQALKVWMHNNKHTLGKREKP